jgi:hypothetical protein
MIRFGNSAQRKNRLIIQIARWWGMMNKDSITEVCNHAANYLYGRHNKRFIAEKLLVT